MGASLILVVQMGKPRHREPKYLVTSRSSWIPPVLFSSTGITFLLVKDKSGPNAEEIKDAIYVTMEILSNWGNTSWVGLTEVEFFDLNNTKLYVSPHDVDIRNADVPGDLGHLVNRNLAVSGGGPE